jgi:hypothetical protein
MTVVSDTYLNCDWIGRVVFEVEERPVGIRGRDIEGVSRTTMRRAVRTFGLARKVKKLREKVYGAEGKKEGIQWWSGEIIESGKRECEVAGGGGGGEPGDGDKVQEKEGDVGTQHKSHEVSRTGESIKATSHGRLDD